VQTGLPGGTYCNLIHGKRQGSSCTGPSVTVAANGSVTVTVGALDAVAIDRANRI
jgi:alpha-amylase